MNWLLVQFTLILCGFFRVVYSNPILCKSTKKSINLEHECSVHNDIIEKLQCVSTYNAFEDIRDEEDEFHRVKLLKKTIVVYSNDGKIYQTKCEKVENVELPNQVVKTCTRDLPISYTINGIKSLGYINKIGIIREDSISQECRNEIEVFNIENLKAARFKDLATKVDEQKNEDDDEIEMNDDLNEEKTFNTDFLFNYSSRIENFIENVIFCCIIFFCFLLKRFSNCKKEITRVLKTQKSNAPTLPPLSNSDNVELKCNICKIKICKTKTGLISHQRACQQQQRPKSILSTLF